MNVRVRGKMTWERRVGQNIRGFLEGGDPTLRDELVVITAYYDSMSVVPAMAPGRRSDVRHRNPHGTRTPL